jgi:DNA polymerase-3 subunit gamma/tau
LGTLINDIKKNTLTAEHPPVTSTAQNTAPVQQEPTVKQESVHKPTTSQTIVPQPIELKTLTDISNFAKQHKERLLAFNIESYIRPISIEPGKLICAFTPDSPKGFSAELAKFLTTKTGMQWEISIKQESSAQTLKENKETKAGLILDELKKSEPLKSVLSVFPKAQIGRIKEPAEKEETPTDELI